MLPCAQCALCYHQGCWYISSKHIFVLRSTYGHIYPRHVALEARYSLCRRTGPKLSLEVLLLSSLT